MSSYIHSPQPHRISCLLNSRLSKHRSVIYSSFLILSSAIGMNAHAAEEATILEPM